MNSTAVEDYVSNFVVGATYVTKEGKSVRIVSEANVNTEYWSVLGDDSAKGWRYADNGFVTGTKLGANDPRNLIIGSNKNG